MVESKKKWRYKPLGELAKIQSGGTPSRGNKDYWDGQIPWVKISDISDLYVSNTEEKISELGLMNSSATLFPKGTILFTIFATIGKVGVLSIDAATNQAIAGITPNKEIDPKFLTYALKDLAFSVENKGKGVAQKNINLTILKSTEIPLPALNDQKRIVQKLDKLFAHLEKIRERLEYLNFLRNKFIESCLVDYSTGNYFPRKVLSDFLEERNSRVGDDWSNYRKIGVSAAEGIIDLGVGEKESYSNYKLVHKGDFIYNTMRVNIGSIAIYDGDEPAITSPDYVVFRVKKYLSKELLLGFLKSENGKLEIGSNTKGSVRSRLYFKSLCQVKMPISEEQIQLNAEKFLSKMNEKLIELNVFSDRTIPSLERAILARAFTGELL